MTATLPQLDEQTIEDMQPACEYALDEDRGPDWDGCHGDGIARWAMHLVICCPACPVVRLACTGCKDDRMTDEGAVECGACGALTAPARHAYRYVEPLGGGK